MAATPHIDFIAAAYAAGLFVIAALIAWVTLDYRLQQRTLAELEGQGHKRRSAATREGPVDAAREDA